MALTGVSWPEPGGCYAFGVLVGAIAILVIWPAARVFGAALALAVSASVMALHVTPWLGLDIPAYGPLMAALAAGMSAEQILALGLPTDCGAHFTLALVNAGLAAIVLGAEAARRQPRPREYQAWQLPA